MSPEVIKEKLARLEEVVSTLKEFQQTPEREFVNERRIYFGAVYALVVGIEVISDIG